jgi:hypothetical protein
MAGHPGQSNGSNTPVSASRVTAKLRNKGVATPCVMENAQSLPAAASTSAVDKATSAIIAPARHAHEVARGQPRLALQRLTHIAR